MYNGYKCIWIIIISELATHYLVFFKLSDQFKAIPFVQILRTPVEFFRGKLARSGIGLDEFIVQGRVIIDNVIQ